MHKNNLDLCIQVIKSFAVSPSRFKVKAAWINLGYTGSPWPLGIIETLDIKTPNHWLDITDDIYKKRDRPGFP